MGEIALNKKPTAEDFEYAYVEDSTGAIVRVPKDKIIAMGKDGGYYIPTVDDDGNLAWSASEEGMPEIAGTNIRGPQGETGAQGEKGDTGEPGYTPVKGTDYYTDDDKQEMVDLVLEKIPDDKYVKTAEQTLTKEQQLQARSNIGAASVAEVSQLSEEIGDLSSGGGEGLSDALKSALATYFTGMQTLLTQMAFSTDNNSSITMIVNAQAVVSALDASGDSSGDDSNGTGGDSGDTEVTLSGISATYTGGNVAVGTALTDLTGIVVIASYSDGSTAVITDYELSGEIVEGSNTITVSYNGLITTFTVTGIAESTDAEWTVVREIGTDNETGVLTLKTGEVDTTNTSWYTSDFIEVPEGATSFSRITSKESDYFLVWYDSNQAYLGSGLSGTYSGNAQYGGGYTDSEGVIWNVVPSEAKYCKVSWRSNATYTSVTFKHNLKLDENVTPEYNKLYYYTTNPNNPIYGDLIYIDDYLYCKGMAYAQIRPIVRRDLKFYDAEYNLVSSADVANNVGNNVAIPSDAVYIKFVTTSNIAASNNQITRTGYGLIMFTETELTSW